MQSVYAPPPGLRALGELARVLAGFGRFLDGLAITLLARLGALLVGLPLLRRRYVKPLHRRSRALRGATVRLHRISAARDPRSPRERMREPRSFHWIEVTIRPRRGRRAPAWRPGDLALVAPAARPGLPEQDDVVGSVRGVARWRNGYWVDQGAVRALVGPQRLRLLVAVTPGAKHFRFRYYLELLRREPRRGATGAPPRPTEARSARLRSRTRSPSTALRQRGPRARAPAEKALASAAWRRPGLRLDCGASRTTVGGEGGPWHWRSCETRG